jgi:1,4-dihydroxy-2-naphthoate octaprenyltransferase
MKQLAEMSIDKLKEQEKLIKVVTGTLAGMLLVLLIVAIVLSAKKGFSPLVAVPFALLPIVVVNMNNLKQIKKELESRRNML